MSKNRSPEGLLKEAFRLQKIRAKKRGIEWSLSFDDWLSVWRESGKLSLRGRGRGFYCMSRKQDAGSYSMGNVSIKLNEDNSSETEENKPYIHRPNCVGRAGNGLAGGYGTSFDKTCRAKPWITKFRGKYLGRFATKEEGRAAYVGAAKRYLVSIGKPIPEALKSTT